MNESAAVLLQRGRSIAERESTEKVLQSLYCMAPPVARARRELGARLTMSAEKKKKERARIWRLEHDLVGGTTLAHARVLVGTARGRSWRGGETAAEALGAR